VTTRTCSRTRTTARNTSTTTSKNRNLLHYIVIRTYLGRSFGQFVSAPSSDESKYLVCWKSLFLLPTLLSQCWHKKSLF
jgi:hypothetical protein